MLRLYRKSIPNFRYYNGTTNEDCLKAIRDKKADVMLQNLYVMREYLQSPLYDGLDIFPAFSFPEEEKIVALPENSVLVSILDKSIEEITEMQQNDIVIAHTIAKGFHASLWEIMYKYRTFLIGMTLLIGTVICLLITILFIRQRHYQAIEGMNGKLAEANTHLEEAVLRANRASAAKSQFLSNMSHEIRTPMNAIAGLTELAKKHEDNPKKVDEYLGKIEISSKVLLNIINDILDMSAIESNKIKIAAEEFSINQIMGGIRDIFSPNVKTKEFILL